MTKLRMVTMHVQKASTSNVCLGCSIEDGRASSGIRFEVFEAVSGLYVPVPHCLLPNFHFHYCIHFILIFMATNVLILRYH